MKIRVRFFGPLALRVGREIEVELPDNVSQADAVEQIFKKLELGQVDIREKGASSGFIKIFVNGKAFDPKVSVKDGDEIIFYPPITGG